MDRLRKGLSVEDQKIVDRLEQLHRDRKTSEKMPSDREMADRLAKLKNVPSPSEEDEERPGQGRSFYAKPDTRADAAKTEDLLKQMGEEVSMDAQAGGGVDPTEEIAERLAKLKGFKVGMHWQFILVHTLILLAYLSRNPNLRSLISRLRKRNSPATRRPTDCWTNSWRNRGWRIRPGQLRGIGPAAGTRTRRWRRPTTIRLLRLTTSKAFIVRLGEKKPVVL